MPLHRCVVTTSSAGSVGYDRAAESHFEELRAREAEYPADPAVFLVGSYYGGTYPPGSESPPAQPF